MEKIMSNKKTSNKDTNIIVAIIGATATIVVAIIGVMSIWVEKKVAEYPSTNNPNEISISPTFTPESNPIVIFKDTFDDTIKGWDNGEYVETYATVELSIRNGMLFRSTETTQESGGYWGTTEIPMVSVKNFCLTFDARVTDYSNKFAIIISLRATNYGRSEVSSHYRIQLSDNGNGAIFIKTPGYETTRQIGEFDNGIQWSDKKMHQVKVSLQDGNLEIYDGQTNSLLHKMNLIGDDLLSSAGEIRLGSEIFSPNQQTVITEYDSVFIYSKCP